MKRRITGKVLDTVVESLNELLNERYELIQTYGGYRLFHRGPTRTAPDERMSAVTESISSREMLAALEAMIWMATTYEIRK